MQGFTKNYFQLFLEAKESYVEHCVQAKYQIDGCNYEPVFMQIARILHSSDGTPFDSHNTRKQLAIEKTLQQKLADIIAEAQHVFEIIRQAVSKNVFDFEYRVQWVEAIQLALLRVGHDEIPPSHYLLVQHQLVADALAYLRSKGFHLISIDGHISPSDNELLRASQAIAYRAQKLGNDALLELNRILRNKYSREDGRYYLSRARRTYNPDTTLEPPFGYLFNLLCNNLDSACTIKSHEKRKLMTEVLELSTFLAAALDVDKVCAWSNISTSPLNIIDKLTEWALYPEIYFMPQISPAHGKMMFPRIFELMENPSDDYLSKIGTMASVMARLENILIQNELLTGAFSESDILEICHDINTPAKLKETLKAMSRPAREINKDYCTPFDATKSNIREVPLVKVKNSYVLTNVGVFNMAKYRCLLSIANSYYDKAELQFGFALERFLLEQLDESGIQYHHSVKFNAPDYIRQITRTSRKTGECDIIIESRTHILLLEVKKKGITKDSLSGSPLSLIQDTTMSILKSINQLSIVELILLKDGKLRSNCSGVEIALDDRQVVKVPVSLEDMTSIQADDICQHLLRGLYNAGVSTDTCSCDRLIDDINKIVDQFTYLTAELMQANRKYHANPFHHTTYLSIPQMVTLLEGVNNNDELANHIDRLNSISLSFSDWHASYKWLRSKGHLNSH